MTVKEPTTSIQPIAWREDGLRLLDQRVLPGTETYLTCSTVGQVANAISDMVVRGAPAIGVTAAWGMAIAQHTGTQARAAYEELLATRPTAVNLQWALDRMMATDKPWDEEAMAIQDEDVTCCLELGRHGLPLFPQGARMLTHCNTGALATAGIGTALGMARTAWAAGRLSRVFADETRPWLQGARLTAWECVQDGIPCTLLADAAAASLLAANRVDLVIVGTDRTAANGDVANKIGTYPLAVLAHRHGVPFYVAAPISSIDLDLAHGGDIAIEERGSQEVTHPAGVAQAPEGIDVFNPVFDVTPSELVTAIVTERGILRPPYDTALRKACLP